jgi:HD-GYP domain-containing protein (c-di-GMP phosphodiesterase class II)
MTLPAFGTVVSRDPPPRQGPVEGDMRAAFVLPRLSRVRPWQRVHALRDTVEAAHAALALRTPGARAAVDAIRRAGTELQRLCALDPDALLAVPLLLAGGHWATRQAIATAVVLETMLARRGTPADRRRSAVLAALTMDVGLAALNDRLYAQAGALNPTERAWMLGHPQHGVDLLADAGVCDAPWLSIVAQHHEHLDGSGYPLGISGDTLLAESQALMVAERWCAMVAPRAYRPGAPPDEALRLLQARLRGEADPDTVGLLAETVGPAPPGTAVRLASGELALVHRRTADPALPMVMVLRSAGGELLGEGLRRSSAEPGHRIDACIGHSALGCPIDPERIWEAAEVAAEGATPVVA